jgi:hypothetical protein
MGSQPIASVVFGLRHSNIIGHDLRHTAPCYFGQIGGVPIGIACIIGRGQLSYITINVLASDAPVIRIKETPAFDWSDSLLDDKCQ